MARAIDADALYDLVERRYKVSNGIEHRCERNLLDLICNMPTLTPPNEPLTLEQLRGMGGNPIVIGGEWGYLEKIEDGRAYFWRWYMDFEDEYVLSEYGQTWVAYRRPPEGEED